MSDILLQPGQISLAEWREIYRGAGAALGPACAHLIERSAAAVAAIVAKGAPVYGIDLGSASSQPFASMPMTWRRSNATSCFRTRPKSAARCRSRRFG